MLVKLLLVALSCFELLLVACEVAFNNFELLVKLLLIIA